MRVAKVLSLICMCAALFFGALQLFDRMRHIPEDLTLQSFLQNAAIDAGALVARLPGRAVQDVVATMFATPAWLVSLCLGGVFWLLARSMDHGD
ncbi:MAG TPA: hypothetical protein VND94_12540 [Terriglobia bacterium]|nr:hypothetical protein [Terriglobia bacterium]